MPTSPSCYHWTIRFHSPLFLSSAAARGLVKARRGTGLFSSQEAHRMPRSSQRIYIYPSSCFTQTRCIRLLLAHQGTTTATCVPSTQRYRCNQMLHTRTGGRPRSEAWGYFSKASRANSSPSKIHLICTSKSYQGAPACFSSESSLPCSLQTWLLPPIRNVHLHRNTRKQTNYTACHTASLPVSTSDP